MSRSKPDPGAWAQVSDEELAGRQRGVPEPQRFDPRELDEAHANDGIAIAPSQTRVSGRRYIAHFADGVVFSLLSLVLLIPAALISSVALLVVAIPLVIAGPVAYYTLTQRRSGQSPGKGMVGIKVVDGDGNPPSTRELIVRSVPLLVDFFYVIPIISMLSSPYRQRLGDRLAHTYVIRDRA